MSLAGNPNLIAIRRGGPIVIMTNHSHVRDIRNGRPRTYSGKFSDYVGLDWEVITGEQLAKLTAPPDEAEQPRAAGSPGR